MTDQLWVGAEVKGGGSVVLVSPTVLPATVEDMFGSLLDKVGNNSADDNEIHNSYNDIHNFIMIFIHDVYKFIPTYRLTLSGYPTRETNWSGLTYSPLDSILWLDDPYLS